MVLEGKNIDLREVKLTDAEFILSLRCDEKKSQFLHKTEFDLPKQTAYIAAALQKTDEYYFIIQSKNGESLGTIRIYDIQDNSFEWGSWLIKDGVNANVSVESVLLMYNFAFYTLNLQFALLDVRRANKSVRSFHLKFGAKIIREDELDTFLRLDKIDFENSRTLFARYIA